MPQRSVREQLIEHAEDVFRQQGFSAASVQDLTVAARVPKGSFYNHFASKQDLAREILIRYVRATDTSMLACPGGFPSPIRPWAFRQHQEVVSPCSR